MKNNVILFDFDGTLIHFNTNKLDLESLRHQMLDLTAQFGFANQTNSIFGMYSEFLKYSGFASELSTRARALISKYESLMLESGYHLLVDIQLVKKIRNIGYKLGIVSNNGIRLVNDIITTNFKGIAFDVVVTRDDVCQIKPSPIPLEKAFYKINEELNLDIKAYYFGDSETDNQATNNFNSRNNCKILFLKVNQLNKALTDINLILPTIL